MTAPQAVPPGLEGKQEDWGVSVLVFTPVPACMHTQPPSFSHITNIYQPVTENDHKAKFTA